MTVTDDFPTQDELPTLVAPMVIRVIVEAWLRSTPHTEGAVFIGNLARLVGDHEEMAAVVPIRRTESGRAAARAERLALAELRQMLPAFVASLPPD